MSTHLFCDCPLQDVTNRHDQGCFVCIGFDMVSLLSSSLAAIAPGLAEKYPTAVPVQVLAAADPLSKPVVEVHVGGLNVRGECEG